MVIGKLSILPALTIDVMNQLDAIERKPHLIESVPLVLDTRLISGI
jgi:hypothetical protein